MSENSGPSDAFTRFADSVKRGVTVPADLESLDLDALSLIRDDERSAAVDLLERQLAAGGNDPRPVDALVQLDTDAAWAAIETTAKRGAPMPRIRAARQLWSFRREPAALDVLRELADDVVDIPMAVQALAGALTEIASDAAGDVLLHVIETTSSPTVRTVVSLALNEMYRFAKHDRIPTGAIWTLRLGLSSRFPSVREQALEDLRDLIDRRRAGQSDDELGIVATQTGFSPEMTAVLQASQDESAPFETGALEALASGERDWAVDLVIRALERGEARAEQALATLGGERAEQALEDWRQGRIDPE